MNSSRRVWRRGCFAFAAATVLCTLFGQQTQASYNQSLTQSVTTAGNTKSVIVGQIDPTNSGAQSFLGIPFAAPPVGALRWHASADPPAWSIPRSATAFGM